VRPLQLVPQRDGVKEVLHPHAEQGDSQPKSKKGNAAGKNPETLNWCFIIPPAKLWQRSCCESIIVRAAVSFENRQAAK